MKISQLDRFLKNEYIFLELNTEIETKLKKVTSQWIKTSLSPDIKVSSFIKEGIDVSENDDFKKCIFCYRDLDDASSNLFLEYKNYFKNERGLFEDLSIDLKNSLNDFKKKVLIITDNLESSFNEYSKLFNLKELKLNQVIEWKKLSTDSLIFNIEVLINKIDEKKKDPSKNLLTSDEISIFENELLALNIKIKFNKDYVSEINKKIKNNEIQRTELRTIIGKKLLYDFIKLNDNKLSDIKINLDELNITQDLLIELKNQASTDVGPKIIDLFNFFLNERIGIKKYKADYLDGKLIINLNNFDISKQTNKISEGEKNMIGLCYFLASSIQKNPQVNSYMNSVFIIDDPICSTSYSNFFGITSLLHKFEIDIKEKIWSSFNNSNIHVQKIIFTHNIQFLNMLSVHVFKKGLFLFLTPQAMNEIKKDSLLSEFQISLLRLYQKKEKIIDENIGNDLRKVFETFRHFYGFDEFNAETVKKIFDLSEDNAYRELYSVSNYYSHANLESNTDPLPPDVLDKALDQFTQIIAKEDSKFVYLWNKTQELIKI